MPKAQKDQDHVTTMNQVWYKVLSEHSERLASLEAIQRGIPALFEEVKATLRVIAEDLKSGYVTRREFETWTDRLLKMEQAKGGTPPWVVWLIASFSALAGAFLTILVKALLGG